MHTTLGAIALLTLLEAALPATVTWDENTTVEQAARQFRIETYERYRLDRDAYDLRMKLGGDLLSRWDKAGQPQQFEDAVVTWYRDAIRAAEDNPSPQLPPIPEISSAEPLVRPRAEARSTKAFLDSATVKALNALEASAPDTDAPAIGETENTAAGDGEPTAEPLGNPLNQIKRVFLRATGLEK